MLKRSGIKLDYCLDILGALKVSHMKLYYGSRKYFFLVILSIVVASFAAGLLFEIY